MSKRTWIALIFFAGLITRTSTVLLCFREYIPSDGIHFHNLAVNVALGNGYSDQRIAPYTSYLLREPLYPLFLAGVYSMSDLFHPIEPIDAYDTSRPEITAAKYVQSLLGALTGAILFLALSEKLRLRIAGFISLGIAIYLPLAGYSALLMRETVQTFLMALAALCFVRLTKSGSFQWRAGYAALSGLSALLLQSMWILFLAGFFGMMFVVRPFKRRMVYSSAGLLIFTAMLSPWFVHSYRVYPDWRIVRSMGTSLTPEAIAYFDKLNRLAFGKLLTSEEIFILKHRILDATDHQRFDMTFSGELKRLRDSLPEIAMVQKIRFFVQNVRTAWIESLWFLEDDAMHLRPHSYHLNRGETLLFLISLIGFVFGYAAFLIPIRFWRKLWVLVIPLLACLPIMPFAGVIGRRFLPVHPYIFLLACVGIYFTVRYVISKRSLVEISDELFLEEATTLPERA